MAVLVTPDQRMHHGWRARPRRPAAGRWLRRLGVGFVALAAFVALCLAITPVRDFIIDQVLYQGDFFFPVHERSTVTRVVGAHPGQPPVVRTVPVRQGRVLNGSMVSTILHGKRRSFRVYLPPGYGDPANRHRRYPVLYLIHGTPGTSASWIRGGHANWIADEEIAAGSVRPLILVMPDLSGDLWRDTECVNKWDGTDREMDYFVREVVPYVDAHFRTIPKAAWRGIGGLSSGGYCAYNIGLHNPRLFRTIFSISGYFHALRGEVFGSNDPFGHDPRFLAANSPDRIAASVPGVRHMHLFIADSSDDGEFTGYATRFAGTLAHLHIRYVLLMSHPHGTLPIVGHLALLGHTWAYWRGAFRHLLPVVSASFGH